MSWREDNSRVGMSVPRHDDVCILFSLEVFVQLRRTKINTVFFGVQIPRPNKYTQLKSVLVWQVGHRSKDNKRNSKQGQMLACATWDTVHTSCQSSTAQGYDGAMRNSQERQHGDQHEDNTGLDVRQDGDALVDHAESATAHAVACLAVRADVAASDDQAAEPGNGQQHDGTAGKGSGQPQITCTSTSRHACKHNCTAQGHASEHAHTRHTQARAYHHHHKQNQKNRTRETIITVCSGLFRLFSVCFLNFPTCPLQ